MNIKRFTFNPFGESTYLVWDVPTGCAAVVDPGMSNSAEERMFDRFAQNNSLTITQIINTHLHLDHCWGNNYVKNRYGVSTAANLEDSFLSERVAQQARMFGLGGDDGDFQPVAIDTELKDGDTISIGESNLQVLAVPGHSPGSIALYDPVGGFVIVGDALFRGAIGRTDLPGGDYKTLSASIRNKLFALPDKTIVYPGHEATTTIGIEKKTNPYV